MRRIINIFHAWLWAKTQHLIWHTKASEGQLRQIIWRLNMNQSNADNQAALALAKKLYKRIYGNAR